MNICRSFCRGPKLSLHSPRFTSLSFSHYPLKSHSSPRSSIPETHSTNNSDSSQIKLTGSDDGFNDSDNQSTDRERISGGGRLDTNNFDGKKIDQETIKYFGERAVGSSEKTRMVNEVFTNVARNYDLMNDLMSVGIHRLWKEALLTELNPQPGMHLLDVAGGTGDIAFRFIESSKSRSPPLSTALSQGPRPISHVTVCDINPNMLQVGTERALKLGYLQSSNRSVFTINFVEANAEELPFQNNNFDAYTIAFGLRNVTHIDKALKEAYRVLKPGGKFFCLEFSKVTLPGLNYLYEQYNQYVVPTLGEWVAKDRNSYQYLIESIKQFSDQETLKQSIADAGFKGVVYKNMTFGIVSLHVGYKLEKSS